MGKTVWDDIADEPNSEEAATRVRPTSGDSVITPRRLSALPWLLAGLTGAGLATSVASNMNERVHTKQALSSSRDEAAELRRGLFTTQDRLATVESERSKEAQTAAQLKQKTDVNEKLIADLRTALDSKDGDVASEGAANRVSVNLVDQILFKSGEAEISPRGKEVLTKVGGVLKGLTDKQILIGGHTDDRPIHTPQFPSNWELSAARAVNVVHFLAETVGVDPARLTAAGYSEFHPRAKRDKAKNRRIEILLTPTVEIKKG